MTGLNSGHAIEGAEPAARQASSFERWMLLSALAILLLLNIALIGFQIATIPVRSAVSIAVLGVLALQYPKVLGHVFRKHFALLILALGLALLGVFVSLVNSNSVMVIARAIMEVHLQMAVTLLVAAMIAEICGARACLIAIAAAVLLSALVAALQFVNVQPAWLLREMLGGLQNQEMSEFSPFIKGRPMGLSFSPIQLGTQVCLAFAAACLFFEYRRDGGKPLAPLGPALLLLLLALAIFAAIAGNRSPILGGVIFFALYSMFRGNAWVGLTLAFGAIVLYFVGPVMMDTLQSTDLRVTRTDDRSAAGRLSLFTLGWRLFEDHPLGYGFAFDPRDYWTLYWHELDSNAGAEVVRDKQLHNYVLSMINVYGIGLLITVPLVWLLLRRAGFALIFFVPYIVHILFHNSGPFWNDNLVWFVIGAASAAALPDRNRRRERMVRRPVAAPRRFLVR